MFQIGFVCAQCWMEVLHTGTLVDVLYLLYILKASMAMSIPGYEFLNYFSRINARCSWKV